MTFLYKHTEFLYYLLIVLNSFALFTAIFFGNGNIFIYAAYMLLMILSFFGFIVLEKLAQRKYMKSLEKLSFDIHGYLDEQYKLLDRIFIGRNVRDMLKLNIALGYINNEQYDEALDIMSELRAVGYSGLNPKMRFTAFANTAKCCLKLNDSGSALICIQSCERILRSISFPSDTLQELSFTFEYLVAEYNYSVNKCQENAQELINRIDNILLAYPKKDAINLLPLRYEKGALCVSLGDMLHADEQFYGILQSNSNLPCVNRIKAYNRAGDISVLGI